MALSEGPTLSAILVAAGSGSRVGATAGQVPKQFVELAGHPMYQWPLRSLARSPVVQQIVITTVAGMVSAVEAGARAAFPGVAIDVIAGGATRQESVWLGLMHLAGKQPHPEFVLVHDAARPFLTSTILEGILQALVEHGACTACIPISDTVKRVRDGLVAASVDREDLVLVQTPQAARFEWLKQAHEHARKNGLTMTDDAGILEAAGYRVAAVGGSPYNLKITQPEDLILAHNLSKSLPW